MEFGTEEILIALAALIILAILIDGVRRVRRSRYDRIRMSRRKQPIFDDDGVDEFGSELPNGGARVVAVRGDDDSQEVQEAIKEAAEAKKPKLSFAKERVDTQSVENQPVEECRVEECSVDVKSFAETVLENDIEPESVEAEPVLSESATAEQEDQQPLTEPQVVEPEQSALELDEPVPVLMDSVDEPQTVESEPLFKSHATNSPEPQPSTEKEPDPNAVIVFHLRAGSDPFKGNNLLDALVKQGMRYGSMKIFHRHSESDGSGPVLFSMANSVEPGTFELNAMDSFTTPGVSFFIALDEVENPSEAFGLMLETIGCVMEAVGGELKDETRSAVTRQTVEHYWQRVRDFERRLLAVDA